MTKEDKSQIIICFAISYDIFTGEGWQNKNI